MLGQRFDQQTSTFQIAPALNLAQSQGQNRLANLGKHWGRTKNTCGAVGKLHQSVDAPCGRPTSGRTPRCRVNKKKAGPKGPASQTGRLHVWETWDHEDPEFQRDQPKPLVSKTWTQPSPHHRHW